VAGSGSRHLRRPRQIKQAAAAEKKKAVPCGTAKFREETSKKADSAANRIAAMHKIDPPRGARKAFFAMQHFAR